MVYIDRSNQCRVAIASLHKLLINNDNRISTETFNTAKKITHIEY